MAKFDVHCIIELLKTIESECGLDDWSVQLLPPLTESEQIKFEAYFGARIKKELLPLIETSAGIKVTRPALFPEGFVEFDFDLSIDPSQIAWPNAYPGAMEIGICEELLYWDLHGTFAGAVYLVDHNGPSHALAFESLEQCLTFAHRHLARVWLSQHTDSDLVWEVEDSIGSFDIRESRIHDFAADEPSLKEFLSSFPGHYSVHDLRDGTIGAGFDYTARAVSENAIWRFQNYPLWVQKQPKNFWDALKWGFK